MKVIVILDDNLGMLFNNRRQSRDRVLIDDIIKTVKDNKIYIEEYSEILFNNSPCKYIISSIPLDEAGISDYCFIERYHLSSYIDSISELIIYRWNRNYPHDFDFDINITESNFKIVSTDEFKGSSHEKITKEVYSKWKRKFYPISLWFYQYALF